MKKRKPTRKAKQAKPTAREASLLELVRSHGGDPEAALLREFKKLTRNSAWKDFPVETLIEEECARLRAGWKVTHSKNYGHRKRLQRALAAMASERCHGERDDELHYHSIDLSPDLDLLSDYIVQEAKRRVGH